MFYKKSDTPAHNDSKETPKKSYRLLKILAVVLFLLLTVLILGIFFEHDVFGPTIL